MFAYPILWWGLLACLDAGSAWRWGVSPMRRDWRHFCGVTVPVSVLYWLIYEYLNLAFPQWRYEGNLYGAAAQTAFGFISFATVVPILIEIYWFLVGPVRGWNLGEQVAVQVKRWPWVHILAGIALTLLPVANGWFWLNQTAWIGPAIALFPFVTRHSGGLEARRLAVYVTISGLLSGFLWELMNYWAITKWIYTIHPDWLRVFEMPLLGYLGFVPFAFSTLAVYEVQFRLPARWPVVAILYLGAIAAMASIVVLYTGRELWIEVG
jgi:hypothetical protein